MLLHCHSYFSLGYGTFSEEELLRSAQASGYHSVALTDINSTSACLNFLRLAPKYNIRPLLGIDFRSGQHQLYVGIAQNNTGFQELNEHLSAHLHSKKRIPDRAPELQHVAIIYPLERVLEMPRAQLAPNEYIGVRFQDLSRLRFSGLFHLQKKIVLLQPYSFRSQRDYNIHRILRAISENSLLSKLPSQMQADPSQTLFAPSYIQEQLRGYEFILHNTQKLMESCQVHFDFSAQKQHQNKRRYGSSRRADSQQIRQLCEEGIAYRYGQPTTEIKNRIEKELQLIEKLDFVPFFLVNWDIVRYAQHKGYFHIGRGSGANSIVAYLLGITDVDPIHLDLYFERFMNLYRSSPPDFDIDFSWRDRPDVTRYIFERFGQQGQTALLATYNTFRHSGAIREIGKVFGLPKHEIDLLSRGRYEYSKLDQLSQLTHRYAQHIYGIPHLLSVHAGGIIIAEKPIHYFSATHLPPKGFPTTQFDMVIAEDVGLYKYDILGQRGLGKIKDAMRIVVHNRPEAPRVDIHDIKPFIHDPKINEMVSRGDTIGCFYVESPAMRMLLQKLGVESYLGLVAASSIIRPGVAQSGMMKEYILRHKDPERRKKAHPILQKIMPDTYGIMVYQEDVIKVAHHFAGLDLGEADVLRRAMSGKYRSRDEFQAVRQKFFRNCQEKKYSSQLAQEVWTQIESFAGYAFAKGHSASYAVESYQSLYLKCYYPLEYMVAVLNNGGGYYRPEIYIHEARMKGGSLHAPCINHSRFETVIEGRHIYLGFVFLHGLEEKLAQRIEQERDAAGPFGSLDDFILRVPIGIEQLAILIRIDAFRFTGQSRRNLLWEAHLKLGKKPQKKQGLLFAPQLRQVKIPELESSEMELLFDQIELLGFTLQSPFAMLAEPISDKELRVRDLPRFKSKVVQMLGYLVSVKHTKTVTGKHMNFGTFLDTEGQWIDTVHFPYIARMYPFRGPGIYRIEARVVDDLGFISLEVRSMQKLELISEPV